MPTTVTTDRPTTLITAPDTLTHQERQVLSAVGCGLRDDEIAAALALPEEAVAGHLARVLVKLGLRDRVAAVVHAFDCGLVVPGRGPRARAPRPVTRAVSVQKAPVRKAPAQKASVQAISVRAVARPRVRISLLGPLQAWRGGRCLELGHLRQQAVLAALALGAGRRCLSQRELLDDVWGLEPPATNVVPVYIYRLRKALHDGCGSDGDDDRGGGGPDAVIVRGPRGYQLAPGAVDVDVARMEELVAGIGRADRAGDPLQALHLCCQALELFRGEPLAGLPGPLAELERLRLVERRVAIVQRKVEWQLRLGQDAEAIDELFAVSAAHPLNEPLAAMLMRALYRDGRQADALTVFERARRRLADDLGVPPSRLLRRAHQMILRGE
ncbi:BTAD domain-containing putative transcriptional regulator [Streptomyces sp. DvalAA-19]|uniref:BTAD domain-containing putative transcriptional regulator n=1 Tax=Streptomyces sp. DvalAA-19 TaxID=1839761 RepID=UPI00081B2F2D|nr:BTAD domain-containing putative transcriptional regulator [Streptomyces sp. DvalAA-19]SCD39494.1 DNA-binding transcriptional activator of the SARP family [Streptomyces sp. DvalAA-19]